MKNIKMEKQYHEISPRLRRTAEDVIETPPKAGESFSRFSVPILWFPWPVARTWLVVAIFHFSFFTLPVAYSSTLSTDQIQKEEERLREIRQKLERSRKKEEELVKKEKGILKQLKELEEALDLSSKRTRRLRGEEKKILGSVEELNQAIDETEVDLLHSQEILRSRLRSIYIHGSLHPLELLLSSKTFTEGAKRMKYWSLITQLDRRVLEGVKRLKRDLDEERGERENKLTELRMVRTETEREEAQQKKEKKERKNLLTRTQEKKKEYKKAVKELEKAARDLETLLKQLERKRKKKETFPPGFHPFEAMKGKLPWPVKGKVVSKFGPVKHPKYETTTQNNGIDIFAGIGEPIHAIGHGRVVFADRFLGYGKILLIDHGGGYYTLYGHLADFSVILDDSVEEGEHIGWVGDTGSLDGSKLHFEFRKNGQPVDPLDWLK